MKLTKHLFFLLLIFISFAGFSQDRTADSLKKVLLAAKNDTIRVKALLELSSFYLDSSPEDAKSYGVQALNLAQKINYHPGRALALKFIGSAYYFLGKHLPLSNITARPCKFLIHWET